MKDYMTLNTKLEVAVELIAEKIANLSNSGVPTNDEKIRELLAERERVYSCDEQTISKVINVYGSEMKHNYEGVGNKWNN